MRSFDEEIKKTREQIKQLEHKQDRLLAKQRIIERKQRTKRLIERGAILESIIGNAEDFSNEQIQSLLIEILSNENARAKIENLRSCIGREE